MNADRHGPGRRFVYLRLVDLSIRPLKLHVGNIAPFRFLFAAYDSGRYHSLMYELPQAIPDVNVLLALEPEELGGKLLFLLRKRTFQFNMFLPSTLNADLWPQTLLPNQQPPYPRDRQGELELALLEAWAWLEAQGLIVPAADPNGRNGWRRLSRRARRFASEAEFANYAVARLLRREMLNSRIADKIWMAFMRFSAWHK
jgi:hypothetical protein